MALQLNPNDTGDISLKVYQPHHNPFLLEFWKGLSHTTYVSVQLVCKMAVTFLLLLRYLLLLFAFVVVSVASCNTCCCASAMSKPI